MDPFLKVENLTKEFRLPSGKRNLVLNNISFEMQRGDCLGLVGASGSGKTTLGNCLTRFDVPTDGKIWIEGQDLFALRSHDLGKFRRKAQMIFQNAYASLNPKMTVFRILVEPIRIHKLCSKNEEKKEIELSLERVGLSSTLLDRYPHELSGGQRQRLVIARALILKPQLLICDEPFSSLDIPIQAQIVDLIKELQKDLNLTLIFISHDLGMVNYLCNPVFHLKNGQLSEN